MRLRRKLAGAVESKLCHVSAFAEALIASLLLAQRLRRSGDIEDVVHDLEQYAELLREGGKPVGRLGFVDPIEQEHALHAGGNQLARLELVQVAQPVAAGPGSTGHVDVLARHHPLSPGGERELASRGQETLRRSLLPGQQEREGLGIEPVAGQDRDVLAERPMAEAVASASTGLIRLPPASSEYRIASSKPAASGSVAKRSDSR